MVMKRVMVSELKAKLSSYLALVRRGDSVVVLDRKTPIARLGPVEERSSGFLVEEPVLSGEELDPVQVITLLKKTDVLDLLRGDREER